MSTYLEQVWVFVFQLVMEDGDGRRKTNVMNGDGGLQWKTIKHDDGGRHGTDMYIENGELRWTTLKNNYEEQ